MPYFLVKKLKLDKALIKCTFELNSIEHEITIPHGQYASYARPSPEVHTFDRRASEKLKFDSNLFRRYVISHRKILKLFSCTVVEDTTLKYSKFKQVVKIYILEKTINFI